MGNCCPRDSEYEKLDEKTLIIKKKEPEPEKNRSTDNFTISAPSPSLSRLSLSPPNKRGSGSEEDGRISPFAIQQRKFQEIRKNSLTSSSSETSIKRAKGQTSSSSSITQNVVTNPPHVATIFSDVPKLTFSETSKSSASTPSLLNIPSTPPTPSNYFEVSSPSTNDLTPLLSPIATASASEKEGKEEQLQNGNELNTTMTGSLLAQDLESLIQIAEYDMEKTPPTDQRDLIVYEIYQTETTYVKSLASVCKGLITPMQANGKLLSSEQQQDIFSNLVEIFNVNDVLLSDLRQRLKKWHTNQQIGDVFYSLLPFLKVYTFYSTHYDKALNALKEHRTKNKALDEFIKVWENKPENGKLPLDSFLILPIQRVPRYSLLFGALLKKTSSSHPDYSKLHAVQVKMDELASSLNEGIKRYENQQKLFQLSEIIKTPFYYNLNLVQPYRVFVRDGPLKKVCRKAIKKRWIFLFNDILIYCTENPFGGYIHHQTIRLSKTRVEDMPDSETKGWRNSFKIISHQKSFVALADTYEDKVKWMVEIQNSIKDLRGKSSAVLLAMDPTLLAELNEEAPIWEPDSEKDNCAICSTKFSLLKRKHHCRKCGILICDDCSLYKSIKLAQAGGEATVRVCIMCFHSTPDNGENGQSDNQNPNQNPKAVYQRASTMMISRSATNNQSPPVKKPTLNPNSVV